MKLSIVLLAFIAVHVRATVFTRGNIEPLSVEHVEFINQLNTTWKATQNFKGYKIDELRGLCGTLLNGTHTGVINLPIIQVDDQKLPKEFDSRKQWPKCANVISHIRDQGSCGSCWAVASASALTGRVCVATSGRKTAQLSAQILTSCCEACGDGCQGGYPVEAYKYWLTDGLVTGADYGDKKTCAPYLLAPCEHHVEGSRPKCDQILPTPKCSLTCTNKQIDFDNDKNYGVLAFATKQPGSVPAIKTELAKGGPLTAAFTVYDDFLLYKEGVYQVTPGAKPVGGHAVELIGWGSTDDGTEYWLMKNNWNTDWGDNGLFKIKIGEAGINDGIVGGIPNSLNYLN